MLFKFNIQTFETLLSTQDEMRSRLEHGEPIHGLVIRALEQTSGRGQRARDWLSSKGGSYQTIAIQDSQLTLNKPYAAIVVAVGITRVVEGFLKQSIVPNTSISSVIEKNLQIKWPNDIYLENKKLAGILCEYTHGHLLIGVGMNVQNEIPQGATRLNLELETVHRLILQGLQEGLELLQINPDLPSLFKPYDFLEGKTLSVKAGSEVKTGIAKGIDQNGCLRLEQNQGLISICSGHIQSVHL